MTIEHLSLFFNFNFKTCLCLCLVYAEIPQSGNQLSFMLLELVFVIRSSHSIRTHLNHIRILIK